MHIHVDFPNCILTLYDTEGYFDPPKGPRNLSFGPRDVATHAYSENGGLITTCLCKIFWCQKHDILHSYTKLTMGFSRSEAYDVLELPIGVY